MKLYNSEEDIIKGCINSKRSAQKAFYDKYSVAMYSVAYRICNSYELANDSLQEAFIQAFKDIHKFRSESTLGSWLKTIVVRTSVRKIKKEKLFVPLSENKYDIGFVFPEAFNGEYIEKAILSLPDGFRTVFLLIEVEGYTHKEVASILNISEGTSKSQLFHAKKRLQRNIKELAIPETLYE